MQDHNAHVTEYRDRCQKLVESFPINVIRKLIGDYTKKSFIAAPHNLGTADSAENRLELEQECWLSICKSAMTFRESASAISRDGIASYVRGKQSIAQSAFRVYASNYVVFAILNWCRLQENRLRIMKQMPIANESFDESVTVQLQSALLEDRKESPDPDAKARLRAIWDEAESERKLIAVGDREKIVLYQRRVLLRTLDEVGEYLGISKERARQLEDMALRQVNISNRAYDGTPFVVREFRRSIGLTRFRAPDRVKKEVAS